MKLTKPQKKFISENLSRMQLDDLASETGLSVSTIREYLQQNPKMKAPSGPFATSKASDSSLKKLPNKLIILILVLVSFLAYLPSIKGELISDDIPGFKENPEVHTIGKSFQIQKLFQAVSYKAFGLNTIPLHSTSIVFHALNAVLVFYLVKLLFDKKTALMASILFAVHPINSEAVAWISGFNYLAHTLTFLLTSLLYFSYKKDPKKTIYLYLSYAVFAVMAFWVWMTWISTIPILILVLDQLVVERKINLRCAIKLLPYFLVTLALFISLQERVNQRVQFMKSNPETRYENKSPIHIRFPFIIFNNVYITAVPLDLSFYHEGGVYNLNDLVIWSVFAFFYFALTIFLIIKKNPIGGLMAFFIASIAPTLSPVPISWYLAERYIYPGAIAFCLALSMILIYAEKKSRVKNLVFYAMLIISIAYFVKTAMRADDWSSFKKLTIATIKTSPNSAKVHNDMGNIYTTENDFKNAASEYETAIRLNNTYSDAMYNAGIAYYRLNEIEKSYKYFEQAVKLDPKLYNGLYNLAVLEHKRGNNEKAIDYFRKSIEAAPNNANAISSLGIVLVSTGRKDEAAIELKRALEINPRLFEASYTLASIETEKGNTDSAIEYLKLALKANPNHQPSIDALKQLEAGNSK